ncbi:hypothetical protein ACTGJ2_01310 [Streptococcus suis]|uniref:hypothetical protein n=1 Tax=Streptococcus TaxID=1301 RepID=UPI00201AFB60|nr:hypothetical protein [Streptococcus suis]MCL4922910.1 hypothetical protein [Streptococcus suis]MDD7566692.1 hypothetical protein [Streptococcus suis]MDY5054142.1 hypothetical protein [Streptococcus suis]HEM6099957.1 hypothetical protein [Streptococcus suis]
MHQLYQMLQDLYTKADQIDYATINAIEKEIEHWLIHSIYAPLKLREKNAILKQHKKKVQTIGNDGENSVKLIANSFDTSIKGEFSKKVQQVVKEKAKEYTKLEEVE